MPPLVPLLLLAAPPARFVAGGPPVEDGIRFVRVAPIDGDARAETRAGKPCLRTDAARSNGYLYFDVGRRRLKARGDAPYRLALTVTYLDDGQDTLAVQYDGVGNTVADNFREVAWRKTGSGEWRRKTIPLDDAEMRNGQQGLADFRIAAGDDGDESIAQVELEVLDASPAAARPPAPEPPPLPDPTDIRIPLGRLTLTSASPGDEAQRIAQERLQARVRTLGTAGPTVQLVVGRWRDGLAAHYPRTGRLVRALAADPTPFRRRDGYVVCVERGGPKPVVCAVGLESPGAVYALSAVQTALLRDARGCAMHLSAMPRVEAPALERRELYLNIGYGLRRPGITVESWSGADWQRYIDALVLARYNAWSFFLWGDGETLHPASANRPLNRRLHETLRAAIAYSHRRGVNVGMQLAPTIVPVALWEKRPDLRARLEYDYPGTLCPSQPEARRLMQAVHGPEIRWFSDVDFYSLWFYDVGGCFCPTCRLPERQLASLLEQEDDYARIARAANPRAEFQVMAWAIWRYEKKHAYSIRERFVAETRRRGHSLADGIVVDPGVEPLFPEIRRAGAPARAFLYQTNIETGQPFPTALTRYLARAVPDAVRAGARGVFLMRMEAGAKGIDDAIAGQYLWSPNIAREDALLAAARAATGDTRAAHLAAQALQRIDDFAWRGFGGGGADAAAGRSIATLARRAVAAAPPALRPGLEWLAVSGDAYAILGAAVEARDDEDEAALATLDRQFAARMRRSPLFARQADGAPYWRNLFRTSLVRFFHSGWSASPF